MPILIDSHVHVYPEYSVEVLLASFRSAISRSGADCGAMCLVERQGVDVFSEWAHGRDLPTGTVVGRSEDNAIVLESPGEAPVAVVAGRQVACAERIEILAIGTREKFSDGMPASEAVCAALSAGALPVLAWGVGKWLFSRSHVVASLLRRFPADELFLGDTSMRPFFWPEPDVMAEAPSFGRRVLHGSDPLPHAGEEIRAGKWADKAEETLASDRPVVSTVLGALRLSPLEVAGRRAGFFEFLGRMIGR